MGDPKFSRRKYDKPTHPWQGDRIKMENELIKKYGLRNKKELWKAQSLLRRFRQRSRELQAKVRYEDKQAEKEREELLKKLGNLGLLPLEGATLNDVLSLDIEAILSRRFQTLAYVKGLAYSPKQSRQLIVHGHAAIGDRKVTIPGYYVKREEENLIRYSPESPLANDLHPARPDMEGPAARPPEEEAKEAEEEEKKKPKKDAKKAGEETEAKDAKKAGEETEAKDAKKAGAETEEKDAKKAGVEAEEKDKEEDEGPKAEAEAEETPVEEEEPKKEDE
jgi:small subunit ribosomal protein S4